MSAAEVARRLLQLGLAKYVAEFAAQGVNMSQLREMDDTDLADLGLPAEARGALLRSLEQGRGPPREPEPQPAPPARRDSVSSSASARHAPVRHRRRDSVSSVSSAGEQGPGWSFARVRPALLRWLGLTEEGGGVG